MCVARQVLPYVLVECDDAWVARCGGVAGFLATLKAGIDTALAMGDNGPSTADGSRVGANERGVDERGAGWVGEGRPSKRPRTSASSLVASLAIVSRVPFFGYHAQGQPFVRISLRNPSVVKRLAGLLLSGAVCGRVMQPYESHVPYLLQESAMLCGVVW